MTWGPALKDRPRRSRHAVARVVRHAVTAACSRGFMEIIYFGVYRFIFLTFINPWAKEEREEERLTCKKVLR